MFISPPFLRGEPKAGGLAFAKFIFFILFLFPCPLQAHESFVRERILMGDVPVQITIKAESEQKLATFTAMEAAFQTAIEITNQVSEFVPTSELAWLNKNQPRQWTKIGDHLNSVLKISKQAFVLTGTFDPTFANSDVGVSLNDVDFLPGQKKLRFKKNLKLGVSGVAKGYIVDQMAKKIRSAGFDDFVVNAGGDLWSEGIESISLAGTSKIIELNHQGMATSGTSERGKHIIDPRNGKKVDHHYSVSVIAESAALADALATGFYVLKLEAIEEIKANYPSIRVIVIEPYEIH